MTHGILHFKLNTFDKTILKIFWILILCEADEKISGAFIAFANFLAIFVISACSFSESSINKSYLVPFVFVVYKIINISCFIFSIQVSTYYKKQYSMN